MIKEFKEFVTRGSVFDVAVGIIIGGAFGPIVKTFVDEILMPPLGLLLGGADFSNLFCIVRAGSADPGPYANLAAARASGAIAIGYGVFINTVVSFLIIAFAVFMLVKIVNRLKNAPEAVPTTRDCPECLMTIPVNAKRCGHCASVLK